MSLSLNRLQTVKIQDPRTAINTKRVYGLYDGGSTISIKDYSTTSYSDSNFIFSCPPPNPQIIVSREIHLQAPITFTVTGTAPIGEYLLKPGCFGIRAYPLSSVMSSLIVTINTQSVSINMSDVIQPLMRYNNYQKDREFVYSVSPSMMDQFTTYEEGFGSIRNPLGAYGDCYEMARGAYPYTSINNVLGAGPGVPVTATVSYLLTEAIFLSPFLWGGLDYNGLIGVLTFDFNFNFGSLSNMVCCSTAGGSTITNVTGHFTSNPLLLFTYITPKILKPINHSYVYSYYECQRYPTVFSPVAPNQTVTIQSQNIQLNSIPSSIVLLVRRQNSDQTFNTTDTFFRINSVQVNFENQTNLLASATELDLYNIARDNGCSLSWEQWHGTTNVFNDTSANGTIIGTIGSVLKLKMGKQIGLNEIQAPGLLGTYQLQVNISCTNTNQTQTITPTFYIITISEGTFTITNNRSFTEIGVMTKKDILDSKNAPYVDYNMLKNVYGGDFLDDISRFGSMFWNGLKGVVSDIGNAVPNALSLANQSIPNALGLVSKVGPLIGIGEGEECGSGLIGDGVVGGRMIKRHQLRRKMNRRY